MSAGISENKQYSDLFQMLFLSNAKYFTDTNNENPHEKLCVGLIRVNGKLPLIQSFLYKLKSSLHIR